VRTGKKSLSKSAISFAWIFESIAFFIMLGGERFREIRSPSGHAKARNRGDRRTAFPSSYQYECSTLNIRVGVSHVAPIAIFFPYRKRLFALSLCNKRDMRREDEQISHFRGVFCRGKKDQWIRVLAYLCVHHILRVHDGGSCRARFSDKGGCALIRRCVSRGHDPPSFSVRVHLHADRHGDRILYAGEKISLWERVFYSFSRALCFCFPSTDRTTS